MPLLVIAGSAVFLAAGSRPRASSSSSTPVRWCGDERSSIRCRSHAVDFDADAPMRRDVSLVRTARVERHVGVVAPRSPIRGSRAAAAGAATHLAAVVGVTRTPCCARCCPSADDARTARVPARPRHHRRRHAAERRRDRTGPRARPLRAAAGAIAATSSSSSSKRSPSSYWFQLSAATGGAAPRPLPRRSRPGRCTSR